jgi:hypothetical protein
MGEARACTQGREERQEQRKQLRQKKIMKATIDEERNTTQERDGRQIRKRSRWAANTHGLDTETAQAWWAGAIGWF